MTPTKTRPQRLTPPRTPFWLVRIEYSLFNVFIFISAQRLNRCGSLAVPTALTLRYYEIDSNFAVAVGSVQPGDRWSDRSSSIGECPSRRQGRPYQGRGWFIKRTVEDLVRAIWLRQVDFEDLPWRGRDAGWE